MTEANKEFEDLFGIYMDNSDKIAGAFLERINKEIKILSFDEASEKDEADGVFDLLRDLSDSAQEEFEELMADGSNKKCLQRTLSKIFALLLNTKVDTAEKIKKISQIAIETTLKR